ncbi:MAG: TonB-dependent receptor [Melioribacteraceae bacterium]|nr:TonB-dependent receptor [Melioribacteraceae bacterium]MCF8420814.1 TonB-dependent receptor [Melioribacteraceae bacterium]
MKNLLLLLGIFISSISLAQQTQVTGKVFDSATREPLPGVNVIIIELENTGAATNINGEFEINVPVGSYSIRASLVGYTPVVKTDVIAKSGRETNVLIELSETALEMNQVEVTADYFDKSIIENDLSTVVLGAEEVRRSPGSSQDFQRILQAMAGVSFSTDQTNELLVRGGSPDENLTVYDNMEIHSTNHYPNEYNSGGPINMINVDLIEDIQFSTGGFISKYGDKLSSVLSVKTREGTRNRLFSGNGNLSMAGYGLVTEGRINDGKGSWILSARNSYINLIAGSFGLTAVPYYYDVQAKAVYDLSKQHKLSFSGIYGNDRIDIEGEPDIENLSMANQSDSVEVETVNVHQYQYAAGLTLKSLWSKNFYSLITLSKNNYNADVDVKYDYTKRNYDSTGEVNSTQTLSSRRVYHNINDNGETAVRSEFVWNINSTHELNFGGALKFIQFQDQTFADADTARFDLNGDGIFDIPGPDILVVRPAANTYYDFSFFENNKHYFYINDKIKLFNDRLIVNVGLRYDHFSYSNQSNISPRFSLSYYLIPSLTSLNFSYGEFYQTQALPLYGDRFQSAINKYC